MNNLSFFSVLRSNLKCALCKNKNCRVRYYPNRIRVEFCGGTRYVDVCQKDKDKKWKEVLKRKLP